MTKVLGFVGSPRRKGYTFVMVSQILDGARDAGSDTEMIFLEGLGLRECDGCHACWKGKPCPKGDGMNDIYAKIAESNVLVFGTPVYWYGPTALMKGLIDRFEYFNCPENRAKIKGKKALLAIPFEEEGQEPARLLVEMFEKSLRYLEMEHTGTILAPGVSKLGDVKEKEMLEECYKAGRLSAKP